MLRLDFPKPVKFICAFIYSSQKNYNQAKKILSRKFGNIDFESERINFDYTDYYYPEMGNPLYRTFLSFEKLKDPSQFIKIKLFCIKLEKKFAQKEKRSVNIDPGYINEAKLVLTTTKDFSHRIYLAKGIYAETTLIFKDGCFGELATTFPDYRTTLYKDIFKQIRNLYTKQLKIS